MQQEIRFATFNVCNLAPPGAKLYDNLLPLRSRSTRPRRNGPRSNWTSSMPT